MKAHHPFPLEVAAVLAAFIRPNHIVYLCSWGLIHLPPTCNSKLFGHNCRRRRSISVSSEVTSGLWNIACSEQLNLRRQLG
jgi:hypothetical protein